MKLIKGLELRPFLRIIWANKKARDAWEVPIQEISNLAQKLELSSIIEDQRTCATITTSARELVNLTSRYPDLIFKPLRLTKKFSGFAHRHEDPGSKDADFYVYLGVSKKLYHINQFYEAYKKGDHNIQGELLGFPKCCREFFSDIWPKGYIDPVWQMRDKDHPHPYSNPLLRYIGVRLSFHIPCSFHCKETIKVTKKRLSLIKENELIMLMEALLSMDMEWDCWHGIAQIKTPLFWIITSSTPSQKRHIVKIKGNFKPREA